MSHRARLLTLPITWRYALTFVDARGLNEDMLPLRAAMLLAISSNDTEVTETALPEAQVEPQSKDPKEDEDDEDESKSGPRPIKEQEAQEEEEEEEEPEEEEEEEGDAEEEEPEEEEEEEEEEEVEEQKHAPVLPEAAKPTLKPKEDSGSDQDEFFNIAHANENAARKLMAKYLKIRTAIRKHSHELAALQRELAALDPSIGAGDAAVPRDSDIQTFAAFMEHQEQNVKGGREDESIAATVKRLEHDKYEGRQRLARNTAKLFGLAGPLLDPGALVEDPDVAAALEECSGTPNVVSRVMGSPVATLGLSLAQMISSNLHKQPKKNSIYNTEKWRRYVASKTV